MKVALLLLLTTFAAFASGCTKKFGCTLEEAAVVGISPLVASQLECKNPAVVQEDLLKVIQKVGFCKPDASQEFTQMSTGSLGLINPTVCVFFGKMVLSSLASNAIPETWECTAESAKEKLGDILIQACAQIK
jgi:hypothetical protein